MPTDKERQLCCPDCIFFLGHAFFSSTSQNKTKKNSSDLVSRTKVELCLVSEGDTYAKEKGYSTQNNKNSQHTIQLLLQIAG